jgi:hypothetical protein
MTYTTARLELMNIEQAIHLIGWREACGCVWNHPHDQPMHAGAGLESNIRRLAMGQTQDDQGWPYRQNRHSRLEDRSPTDFTVSLAILETVFDALGVQSMGPFRWRGA